MRRYLDISFGGVCLLFAAYLFDQWFWEIPCYWWISYIVNFNTVLALYLNVRKK